jgi:hypothetical protein
VLSGSSLESPPPDGLLGAAPLAALAPSRRGREVDQVRLRERASRGGAPRVTLRRAMVYLRERRGPGSTGTGERVANGSPSGRNTRTGGKVSARGENAAQRVVVTGSNATFLRPCKLNTERAGRCSGAETNERLGQASVSWPQAPLGFRGVSAREAGDLGRTPTSGRDRMRGGRPGQVRPSDPGGPVIPRHPRHTMEVRRRGESIAIRGGIEGAKVRPVAARGPFRRERVRSE